MYDNFYYEYIDPRQGKQLRSDNYDKTMITITHIKENKCFQIIDTCTNC